MMLSKVYHIKSPLSHIISYVVFVQKLSIFKKSLNWTGSAKVLRIEPCIATISYIGIKIFKIVRIAIVTEISIEIAICAGMFPKIAIKIVVFKSIAISIATKHIIAIEIQV